MTGSVFVRSTVSNNLGVEHGVEGCRRGWRYASIVGLGASNLGAGSWVVVVLFRFCLFYMRT